MTIGTLEVLAMLALIVFIGTVLTYWDSPLRNRGRYSGRTFDPQRPVIRRAGAVGYTGKKCELCGMTTFSNFGDRCGACGRTFSKTYVAPTESTKRLSLLDKAYDRLDAARAVERRSEFDAALVESDK